MAKLAAAGVVDGYPDGTFKGDKTMTRYEMAQIVAKALAKGAIGADDKLVSEFADELDNLGVRVAETGKECGQCTGDRGWPVSAMQIAEAAASRIGMTNPKPSCGPVCGSPVK